MRKLLCFIFGHRYRKVVYANNKYDVYKCPICGKEIFLIRNRDNIYYN